jgi:hypothetical protein
MPRQKKKVEAEELKPPGGLSEEVLLLWWIDRAASVNLPHGLKAYIISSGQKAQIKAIVEQALQRTAPRPLEHAEPRLACWTQGGSLDNLTIAQAGEYVLSQKDVTAYAWEVRDPGVDAEKTWHDGKHEFPTLAQAVDNALPYWQEIGLTWTQAALVALSSDLVLSTGASVDELFDEVEVREGGLL